MAWSLHRDGSIHVRRLSDGQVINRLAVPDAERLTSWSIGIEDDRCAFGYTDGNVRHGTIGFATEFVMPEAMPADLRGPAHWRGGAVPRRGGRAHARGAVPLSVPGGRPRRSPATRAGRHRAARPDRGHAGPVVFVALDATGTVHVREVRERRNLLTGKTTRTMTGKSIDLAAEDLRGDGGMNPPTCWSPARATTSCCLWPTDAPSASTPPIRPTPAGRGGLDLLPEPGRRLTAWPGRSARPPWWPVTMPAASAPGSAWPTRATEQRRPDPGPGPRPRGRGAWWPRPWPVGPHAHHGRGLRRRHHGLYHVTSDQVLALAQATTDGEPVDFVAISPRDDILLTLSHDQARIWQKRRPSPGGQLERAHGQGVVRGLPSPAYVWQSSAATDSFEPKYSLMPLIFGTLKATSIRCCSACRWPGRPPSTRPSSCTRAPRRASSR